MIVNKDLTFHLVNGQLFEFNKLYNFRPAVLLEKDVLFEYAYFNVLFKSSTYYFNHVLEKRFWIYNDLKALPQCNFVFQKEDIFEKRLFFDLKTKKQDSLLSSVYVCDRRENILKEIFCHKMLRGKIIVLNKCGFNILALGLKVPLLLDSTPKRQKKQLNFLYSRWFTLTLNYIGVLTFFSLSRWKLRLIQSFLKVGKKTLFYYKKNIKLKSSLFFSPIVRSDRFFSIDRKKITGSALSRKKKKISNEYLSRKRKKKRLVFCKYEKKRVLLKAIFKNSNLPSQIRQKAYLNLTKLPRNSSKTRLKDRCMLTGRSRFVLQSFQLSRLTLRNLICNGLIPGVIKSSW